MKTIIMNEIVFVEGLEATDAFSEWLLTFLDEKKIGLDIPFEFVVEETDQFMNYGVVVEAMLVSSVAEKAQIKNTLVKIDFKNGDVYHYLRFLGECMAKQKYNEENPCEV